MLEIEEGLAVDQALKNIIPRVVHQNKYMRLGQHVDLKLREICKC